MMCHFVNFIPAGQYHTKRELSDPQSDSDGTYVCMCVSTYICDQLNTVVLRKVTVEYFYVKTAQVEILLSYGVANNTLLCLYGHFIH